MKQSGSSPAPSVILMAVVIGLNHAAAPLRREEGHVLSAPSARAIAQGGTAVAFPRPTVAAGEVSARPHRPRGGHLLVHALLLASIAVIAFPLYYAFVISPQDLREVVQRPPRLLPSTQLVENYVEAWRRSGMATQRWFVRGLIESEK